MSNTYLFRALAMVVVVAGIWGAVLVYQHATAPAPRQQAVTPPTPAQPAPRNASRIQIASSGKTAQQRTTATAVRPVKKTAPAEKAASPAKPQPATRTNDAAARKTAPPAMPSREEMERMREANKYHMQLMRLVGNIERLERESTAPLTAQQARLVLDILTPLRTKDKLTEDMAKETILQLQRVLTVDQRTEIGKLPERRFGGAGDRPGNPPNAGPGGPPDGGGGGPPPGGPPLVGNDGPPAGERPGGGPPRFNPAMLKDFNPFHPAAGQPGPDGDRWEAFFTALEAKAAK